MFFYAGLLWSTSFNLFIYCRAVLAKIYERLDNVTIRQVTIRQCYNSTMYLNFVDTINDEKYLSLRFLSIYIAVIRLVTIVRPF